MLRPFSSGMQAAVDDGRLRPIVLAALTFLSKAEYCWTGIGTLMFDGNPYLGVGALGRISTVTEGTDIQAYGMTVGLAGCNPALYQEAMNDIKQGLPALLYAGFMSDTGDMVGAPYCFFDGWIDDADIDPDPDNMTITLNLENAMADLQRAPMLRLTSADQAILCPTDSAMDWQPTLADAPLRWGT